MKRLLILSLVAMLALGAAIGFAQDERPWVGIGIDDSDDSVVVTNIVDDSPAAEAGLETGDVITAVNGDEIASPEALVAAISELSPDDVVAMSITRGDETLEIDITLGVLPQNAPNNDEQRDERNADDNAREGRGDRDGRNANRFGFEMQGFLGVQFQNLTADFAANLGIETTEGALVVGIVPDSPAEAAGIAPGDIIVAVDGDVIDEERTLADRLFAYEVDDTVTLTVISDGESSEISVTLDDRFDGMRNFEFMPRGGMGMDGNGGMFFGMPFMMPGMPDDEHHRGGRFEFDFGGERGDFFGEMPFGQRLDDFSVVCTDADGNTIEFGFDSFSDFDDFNFDFTEIECEIIELDEVAPETDGDA